MANEMTIGNMPVDIKAKLGVDVRKSLSDIIEKEFKNRVDVDYNAKNEKRKVIIEKHRKRLAIDKLISEYKKIKIELEDMQNKLTNLGFRDGSYQHGGNKDIEEELNSLNKDSQEIFTVKHKLQTRLSLATTVGEATVIMHEILGNTLIPSLTKNAICFQNQGE